MIMGSVERAVGYRRIKINQEDKELKQTMYEAYDGSGLIVSENNLTGKLVILPITAERLEYLLNLCLKNESDFQPINGGSAL